MPKSFFRYFVDHIILTLVTLLSYFVVFLFAAITFPIWGGFYVIGRIAEKHRY